MNYKKEKTLHQRGVLDVEVDPYGNVVSVWYNCLILPFREVAVSMERAEKMVSALAEVDYEIVEIQTKKAFKIPDNLNTVLRKVVQHYWCEGVTNIGINQNHIQVVVLDRSLESSFPKILDGVLIKVIWAK